MALLPMLHYSHNAYIIVTATRTLYTSVHFQQQCPW